LASAALRARACLAEYAFFFFAFLADFLAAGFLAVD
jgi:hypothetical protein